MHARSACCMRSPTGERIPPTSQCRKCQRQAWTFIMERCRSHSRTPAPRGPATARAFGLAAFRAPSRLARAPPPASLQARCNRARRAASAIVFVKLQAPHSYPGSTWRGSARRLHRLSPPGPSRPERIRPKTKDQGPKTKDQGPKTKDQRPRTKDQRPKTKDQRPKTKAQRPNTKEERPTTKDQGPMT